MIKIKNLSFTYGKTSALFDRLHLEMEHGRIVGLLGKNGAGKSTLLNLIAGYIPPQQGEITVGGFVPFERKPAFLADVYMVPEEFSFPGVSIETYVKAYSPFYPHFDRAKLDKILTEFELKYGNNLNKLSHGQRKKFLIAFALASNCRLLLLDEPTNGLDIPSKSQFRKILASSVSDNQLVVISTHQVKDIDTVIDTIVAIDYGKIIYEKSMDEILNSLHFDTVPSLNGLENVLYSETCASGYKIVQPTDRPTDSIVDLELLFNAIVNKKLPPNPLKGEK